MEVIVSKQVLSSIEQYGDTLALYPISNNRAKEKVDNMFSVLSRIGSQPYMYPVCKYSDLGQSLDRNRNPKNQYLRQLTYKDKADKPWTFAYLVDERNERVYITSMRFSSYVVRKRRQGHTGNAVPYRQNGKPA